MKKMITDFDLIRFIYHETTQRENILIKERICTEWETESRFNDFRRAHGAFGTEAYLPNESSINIIMKHSKNVEIELEALYN